MNSIILHNVTPAQCQSWSKYYYDYVTQDIIQEKTDLVQLPDKLPQVLKSLNDWPQTTNLACWNCTRKFTNRPWYIPGETLLTVNGNFCNAPCSIAWILKNKEFDNINTRKQLSELSRKMFDLTIIAFIGAPNHTVINTYGGPLTPEEYEQEIQHINKRIFGL